MSNQRYDIYRLIHKGLRFYLTDTLQRVGKLDCFCDQELTEGMTQLRELLTFCQAHLEHENTFIHPAMEARCPGSAESMYYHHQSHVEMIAELNMLALAAAQISGESRAHLQAELYRKLALFVADNLAHMDEEETGNNRILWEHYSDDEILAIEHALIQSLPPKDNQQSMLWMLPAMNHHERRQLLSGMQSQAPAEVFAGVLDLARECLPATDWQKLELALAG